jgi:hypothetical protein
MLFTEVLIYIFSIKDLNNVDGAESLYENRCEPTLAFDSFMLMMKPSSTSFGWCLY